MKNCNFSRSQTLTIALVAFFLLCLYGWRHFSHQSVKSDQSGSTYVFVQISGKVETPGIYSFNKSVTVGEAVARAGGLCPPLKWQAESAWEKMGVENARKIHIKAATDGYAALRMEWMEVPRRLALGVPLDINQASAAELALVPGINDKLAERIVMRRQSTGGFSGMSDLIAVKGIGPATLKRLQPFLTLTTEH